MPDARANFWRRSAAWCLDWLLLSPVLALAIGSRLGNASAQFDALQAQLEDWLYAQALQAESVPDLWQQLARSVAADTALQARVSAAILRLCGSLTGTLAIASLLAAAYFIVFEAGAWQATPGKRLLGLRVLAIDGQPLPWSRTALRYFAGSLSWLSLNLGHALALFRRDGRALHDLIAGAVVVARVGDG